MIGIAAHQRRQIEGDAQAGRPCRQQLAVALIGVFWRPEPGELPHRPELASIAGGMNAARIGKRPGLAQLGVVVELGNAVGGVEPFDRPA